MLHELGGGGAAAYIRAARQNSLTNEAAGQSMPDLDGTGRAVPFTVVSSHVWCMETGQSTAGHCRVHATHPRTGWNGTCGLGLQNSWKCAWNAHRPRWVTDHHVPAEAATLQQVINAWYRQGEYNALTYTDGVVVVQLGRFVNGRKNMTPISGEAIWLPIFAEGINVVWESFRVTAVQVHLGHSPHQGHYRSLLRAGGLWLYQDDGCQAKQVTFSAIHKRHGYLVWLLKSCA